LRQERRHRHRHYLLVHFLPSRADLRRQYRQHRGQFRGQPARWTFAIPLDSCTRSRWPDDSSSGIGRQNDADRRPVCGLSTNYRFGSGDFVPDSAVRLRVLHGSRTKECWRHGQRMILILPVLVFAFSFVAAISQFVLDMENEYGRNHAKQTRKVIRNAVLLLTVFTMFFVWSSAL